MVNVLSTSISRTEIVHVVHDDHQETLPRVVVNYLFTNTLQTGSQISSHTHKTLFFLLTLHKDKKMGLYWKKFCVPTVHCSCLLRTS